MTARELCSVLYVDDDADICEVVQTTLCVIAGLEVHLAGSGEEAIDRAYECRPDLILMDVMMPGLDGPSTLRRMRDHVLLEKIPIAFLTAKVLPAEIARFRAIGAIGVLEKPFDPARLGSDLLALWTRAQITGHGPRVGPPGSRASSVDSSPGSRFLERANRDVAHILDMVQRVINGDASALRDIESLAHSLHGSAAVFGFPKVSALGGAIERLVGRATAMTDRARVAREAVLLKRIVVQAGLLAGEVDAAAKAVPDGAPLLRTGG